MVGGGLGWGSLASVDRQVARRGQGGGHGGLEVWQAWDAGTLETGLQGPQQGTALVGAGLQCLVGGMAATVARNACRDWPEGFL